MFLKSVILLYLLNSFYLVQCKIKKDVKHIGASCVGQDKTTGTCLELYKCPSAVIIYLYYNHGYDVPDLPEVCSYEDTEPVVCCTDCFIDEKKISAGYQLDRFGALVNTQQGPYAADFCHHYILKQPYPCLWMDSFEISKHLASNKTCHLWRVDRTSNVSSDLWRVKSTSNASSVVEVPAKKEFTHLALIGYGEDKDNVQWLCGGTVIYWNYVLVAAHCASHPTLGQATYVASGLYNPVQKWMVHEIEKIDIHPDYKPPSRYHDIALLYLVSSYDFTKDLLPACMDTTNVIPQAVQGLDWSRFGGGNELEQNLKVADLSKFDDAKCKELFPPDDVLEHGYDPNTQTCYGNPKKIVGTCEGNNAGLIQTSYHDCQYTVTGVKSYSKNCGTADAVSIYTRVQAYMPWIERIIWDFMF